MASTSNKRPREDDGDCCPPKKRQKQSYEQQIITLNVGGVSFATTRCTLCNIKSTYFARRFKGQYDEGPTLNRQYFIDRDATHFRYILQYLRDGKVVLPEVMSDLKQLLIEAKFYGMDSMVQGIETEIQTLKSRKDPCEAHLRQIKQELSSLQSQVIAAGAMAMDDSGPLLVMKLGQIQDILEEQLEHQRASNSS